MFASICIQLQELTKEKKLPAKVFFCLCFITGSFKEKLLTLNTNH